MEENYIEQVRRWIRSLDQRPGVYLIENTVNGACYVGSATKSLRQRLRDTLTMLNGRRHHSYLLQADWRRFGAENFAWWASYASSAADALKMERELAIAADAFEDFGGYCQRTGKNCAAASFRETERKLAKARVPRYQFLPGVRIEDRIPEVLLRTPGNPAASCEARGYRAKEPSPNPLAVQWKMGVSTHLFRFTAGPLQAES